MVRENIIFLFRKTYTTNATWLNFESLIITIYKKYNVTIRTFRNKNKESINSLAKLYSMFPLLFGQTPFHRNVLANFFYYYLNHLVQYQTVKANLDHKWSPMASDAP